MKGFDGISTEELEKRINERQQFLEKVTTFVADIVQLIGKTMEFSETDSYSTFTKEIIGFGHFSFTYHSSYGLKRYTVWYHPKGELIETDVDDTLRAALISLGPVLVVENPHDKEMSTVKVFNESNEWQTALLNAIEHRDEFLAQRKKAEEERKEKLRLQTEGEHKRAELLVVAKRLKV